MSELRFSNVRVNGITLHLAEAGPDDGPLLFLLHGFPEYWRAWKDYILPFAAAGFHVIAPDQRGYNLSEKPKDIAAYDLDQLAADISALPIVGARGAFRLSVTIGAGRLDGGSQRRGLNALTVSPSPTRRIPPFGASSWMRIRSRSGEAGTSSSSGCRGCRNF
jgi:hypothetical protein